jgi:hypothetical protein
MLPQIASVPTLDYLTDPVVSAFMDAREHEAFYLSLKHVVPRRDFHERLVPVLEKFLEMASLPANEGLIDAVIGSASVTMAEASDLSDLLQKARILDPRGFDLMQLTGPLNYGSLKKAYRLAALRCHPDAGGSHEQMVAVNRAMSTFEQLLRSESVLKTEGSTFHTEGGADRGSCRDYMCRVARLLFVVAIDEWNLDGASRWLLLLRNSEWLPQNVECGRWHIGLLEPAATLAARLGIAGKIEEASNALSLAKHAMTYARSAGLSYDHLISRAKKNIGGQGARRLTVNHARQMMNARRLGLIDNERAGEILTKIAAREAGALKREQLLHQHLARYPFQPRPYDRQAYGKVAATSLVPEPDYFCWDIQALSDDQQAEYIVAFSSASSERLVRKYIYVRLFSILQSVIFSPDALDFAAIEQECQFLSACEGSVNYYASEILAFLDLLRKSSAQVARLKLLGLLHRAAPASLLSDCRIGITSPYLRIAVAPLTHLEQRVAICGRSWTT